MQIICETSLGPNFPFRDNGIIIALYCENNKIVLSHDKEIINLNIKCQNQIKDALSDDKIINELLSSAANTFYTITTEISEFEVSFFCWAYHWILPGLFEIIRKSIRCFLLSRFHDFCFQLGTKLLLTISINR